MDDVEKIVLYFPLHKQDTVSATQIQKWARFPRDRMLTALHRCNNVVFRLEENGDDSLGFDVVLIDCPETSRIIKKHEDLVGRR